MFPVDALRCNDAERVTQSSPCLRRFPLLKTAFPISWEQCNRVALWFDRTVLKELRVQCHYVCVACKHAVQCVVKEAV